MTFEELQRANTAMIPTNIGNGKEYMEVNQRIKAFRMVFPMGSIQTDLVSNENGVCVFKASVIDDAGRLLGTGTAYEKEGNGFINKTSYIENCETSAVGRALAMCGFGIDTSIASYEEVANAKEQQKAPEQPKTEQQKAQDDAIELAQLKAKVLGYINRHNMSAESVAQICKCYKIENIQQMTIEHCNHYIAVLERKGGNIES